MKKQLVNTMIFSILATMNLYSGAAGAVTWTHRTFTCKPGAFQQPSVYIRMTYLESVADTNYSPTLHDTLNLSDIHVHIAGPGIATYDGAALGAKFYSVGEGQVPDQLTLWNLATVADGVKKATLKISMMNPGAVTPYSTPVNVMYAAKSYQCNPQADD